MTNTASNGTAVLPVLVDVIKASVDKTHSAFFSEKPEVDGTQTPHDEPCIAGIISFLGDESFSLAWILSRETAPTLAQRFTGFEIPFDSSDMGDMAGELINVIAGEIVAQLEQRRIKVQMSLPTVARGRPLELVPQAGPTVANVQYRSKEGPFWFRIAAANGHPARLSGK